MSMIVKIIAKEFSLDYNPVSIRSVYCKNHLVFSTEQSRNITEQNKWYPETPQRFCRNPLNYSTDRTLLNKLLTKETSYKHFTRQH